MTSSQESITFSDLEIYKGHRFNTTRILDTKLYKKPTNPQTFLHFDSCHSSSTFPTIVRGELLRALRATSDAENYSIAVNKLLECFQERGYPKQLLMKASQGPLPPPTAQTDPSTQCNNFLCSPPSSNQLESHLGNSRNTFSPNGYQTSPYLQQRSSSTS